MSKPEPALINATVILVHPNALLSENLRRLLENTLYEVAHHAAGFETIEAKTKGLKGRLLVLAGGSTPAQLLETVKIIRRRLNSAHILALGATREPREVMLALEAGADGYLHEKITLQKLITTIAILLENQTVVPSTFVKRLALPSPTVKNLIGLDEVEGDPANLKKWGPAKVRMHTWSKRHPINRGRKLRRQEK